MLEEIINDAFERYDGWDQVKISNRKRREWLRSIIRRIRSTNPTDIDSIVSTVEQSIRCEEYRNHLYELECNRFRGELIDIIRNSLKLFRALESSQGYITLMRVVIRKDCLEVVLDNGELISVRIPGYAKIILKMFLNKITSGKKLHIHSLISHIPLPTFNNEEVLIDSFDYYTYYAEFLHFSNKISILLHNAIGIRKEGDVVEAKYLGLPGEYDSPPPLNKFYFVKIFGYGKIKPIMVHPYNDYKRSFLIFFDNILTTFLRFIKGKADVVYSKVVPDKEILDKYFDVAKKLSDILKSEGINLKVKYDLPEDFNKFFSKILLKGNFPSDSHFNEILDFPQEKLKMAKVLLASLLVLSPVHPQLLVEYYDRFSKKEKNEIGLFTQLWSVLSNMREVFQPYYRRVLQTINESLAIGYALLGHYSYLESILRMERKKLEEEFGFKISKLQPYLTLYKELSGSELIYLLGGIEKALRR